MGPKKIYQEKGERNNATEHSFDQRLPGFRLMNGSAVGRFGNETAPCNTTVLAITSTVKHRMATHPRCIRRPIGPRTSRTPRRPGVRWRGPGLLLRRRSSRRRSQAKHFHCRRIDWRFRLSVCTGGCWDFHRAPVGVLMCLDDLSI